MQPHLAVKPNHNDMKISGVPHPGLVILIVYKNK